MDFTIFSTAISGKNVTSLIYMKNASNFQKKCVKLNSFYSTNPSSPIKIGVMFLIEDVSQYVLAISVVACL